MSTKETKKISWIVAIIFVIIAISVIIALSEPVDTNKKSDSQTFSWAVINDTENPPEEKANFYIIRDDVERSGYGFGHIIGRIYNNYQRVSYLSITFGIYNQNDVKIGTCMDNIAGLDLGQTWSYDAYCSNLPDNLIYKIEDVTYY